MVSVEPLREVHAGAADLDRLGVKVHDEVAGLNHRLRMSLGAAHNGVDARDQLVLVERFGHVIVGAEAKTAHLVLDAAEAGQDQYRGLHLRHPQRAQNLVAGDVWQVQIEQYDIVIVELAEIDTLFAKVGGIEVEALRLKHQLNGLSDGGIVFNQQNAHSNPLPRHLGWNISRLHG